MLMFYALMVPSLWRINFGAQQGAVARIKEGDLGSVYQLPIERLLDSVNLLPMTLGNSSNIQQAMDKAVSHYTLPGMQLGKLHNKLQSRNNITIGVLGGSITAGGAAPGLLENSILWVDEFARLLEDSFGVHTQVYNAAVGGTATEDSFYSLEARLPPGLDIILWEHNLNDAMTEEKWAQRSDMRAVSGQCGCNASPAWLLLFLCKAIMVHPNAFIGQLYSWNMTIGLDKQLCPVHEDCSPEQTAVSSLVAKGHDLGWASYEKMLGTMSKTPETVRNRSHYDAFGHLLSGRLVAYVLLRHLHDVASSRGSVSVGTDVQSNGAPTRALAPQLAPQVLRTATALGPFVAKGIANHVAAYTLIRPYYDSNNSNPHLTTTCIHAPQANSQVLSGRYSVFSVESLSADNCRNFAMWGKSSANRRDQKWGVWIPPCGGGHLLQVNVPPRNDFPGKLNEAAKLPHYINIRAQYSMYRHEWKELDLNSFNVTFTGIDAARVNTEPWSAWHFRLNWTSPATQFSFAVCSKAKGTPQLPPAALDPNNPGVWLTDVFLV
jgi:hypothetical protein